MFPLSSSRSHCVVFPLSLFPIQCSSLSALLSILFFVYSLPSPSLFLFLFLCVTSVLVFVRLPVTVEPCTIRFITCLSPGDLCNSETQQPQRKERFGICMLCMYVYVWFSMCVCAPSYLCEIQERKLRYGAAIFCH